MSLFNSPDPKLFFSRKDPLDPRLGDRVTTSPDKPSVAVLGYPDDDGVKLNGGRLGAKMGPDAIRYWLYRMTPHPRKTLRPLFDLGNVEFHTDLAQRHADVSHAVQDLLSKEHRVLALGGGNDYAYADGLGFLQSLKLAAHKPVIINVDAHLDVRNLDRGLSSGTPFYRLLESGHDFHFIELGIQPHCSARAHWDYVESKGGQILSADDCIENNLTWLDLVKAKLAPLLRHPHPVFLALDMDAFATPYVSGTSANWPLGMEPKDFLPILHLFLKSWDVRVLGIYETAPELESGSSTAQLAALWAHPFLHESE